MEHNSNHQHDYFKENVDPRFTESLLKELDKTVFVDSNHGHDSVTGKAITGSLEFVGSPPAEWGATLQPSVQTATCGAELNALKKAVEHAFTIRYYLRSMGVKVEQPTRTCCDNKSAVTNTTEAGILNEKCLAVACHFCREYFSADVVDIRWVDGKHNLDDDMTKALGTTAFYAHMSRAMSNA